jgi:hypothetical protein
MTAERDDPYRQRMERSRHIEESATVGGIPIPREGDPRSRWFWPKPTVRILFYTDTGLVNLDDDWDANEFGVRILHDLIVEHESDLADFEISLVNRHRFSQADHKLTPKRLADFDEVWFFGYRQADTSSEPENELTDPEVAALEDWMATGGVLITGDHANPRPPGADPHLDDLLALGRAIGHRVPRAGALRRWEGGPPQFGPGSFNTQVPTPEIGIDHPDFEAPGGPPQEDEWPQELILKTFPTPSGPLDPTQPFGGRVHRLFCGRTRPITVFPDHMHEGELVTPTDLPVEKRPIGPAAQPLPEVIARGTDKRTGAVYDIVSAYDGSLAGVGRIVADSTWHHYFNVNLKGFPSGGHVRTQLGQFFLNLAVWLAPTAKRAAISRWQLWKLVHNPTVLMTYGNSRIALGKAAAGVLRRTEGPCVLRDVFEPLVGAAAPSSDVLEPSPELLLGGVVEAYLDAFDRADEGDPSVREESIDALFRRGLRAAHEDFTAALEDAAVQAGRARALFEERLNRDDGGAARESHESAEAD